MEGKKAFQNSFGKKGWLLVFFYMALYFVASGVSVDGLNVVVPALAANYDWSTGTLFGVSTVGGWAGIIGSIILICI